jgi:hypothetical protein
MLSVISWNENMCKLENAKLGSDTDIYVSQDSYNFKVSLTFV